MKSVGKQQSKNVQFRFAQHCENTVLLIQIIEFEETKKKMDHTLESLPGLDLILPIIVDSLDIKSICQLRYEIHT